MDGGEEESRRKFGGKEKGIKAIERQRKNQGQIPRILDLGRLFDVKLSGYDISRSCFLFQHNQCGSFLRTLGWQLQAGSPIRPQSSVWLSFLTCVPASLVDPRSSLIYSPQMLPGLSSRDTDKMTKNADGGVMLYFGPEAPNGLEANWVPTSGEKPNAMFRFYGPEEAFYNKTFKLADVELVM